MAARTRRTTLNDRWREKIRASMLVNRLHEHALAPEDNPVMSSTQIRAAEILLNKVAPDLKAIEHTGQDGEQLEITVNVIPHAEPDGA